MEKTTINTFLYTGTSPDKMEKLVDITSYPALFSAPERLDWSDMSSDQKKYVPGMVDLSEYEFGYNYTKERYEKCKALKGNEKQYFQLRFGANGEYGCWQWQGDCYTTTNEGSVGAVRTAKIVCYPQTDITEVTISPATQASTN